MNTDASATNDGQPSIYAFYEEFCATVKSPFNEHVTGEELGRPVSFEDELVHFASNKGPDGLRRRFEHEHPGFLASQGVYKPD
ncbi:MAG: hypothetical protein P4L61_02585 [Candidatus Pacebacteria bacterium]|nr:hypothetical protein [Candidatus Paceibacterota bacterium]